MTKHLSIFKYRLLMLHVFKLFKSFGSSIQSFWLLIIFNSFASSAKSKMVKLFIIFGRSLMKILNNRVDK